MLRNGEDYDLLPEEEEEDRPFCHSKGHCNIRGKEYFNSKNLKNNKSNEQ